MKVAELIIHNKMYNNVFVMLYMYSSFKNFFLFLQM